MPGRLELHANHLNWPTDRIELLKLVKRTKSLERTLTLPIMGWLNGEPASLACNNTRYLELHLHYHDYGQFIGLLTLIEKIHLFGISMISMKIFLFTQTIKSLTCY